MIEISLLFHYSVDFNNTNFIIFFFFFIFIPLKFITFSRSVSVGYYSSLSAVTSLAFISIVIRHRLKEIKDDKNP